MPDLYSPTRRAPAGMSTRRPSNDHTFSVTTARTIPGRSLCTAVSSTPRIIKCPARRARRCVDFWMARAVSTPAAADTEARGSGGWDRRRVEPRSTIRWRPDLSTRQPRLALSEMTCGARRPLPPSALLLLLPLTFEFGKPARLVVIGWCHRQRWFGRRRRLDRYGRRYGWSGWNFGRLRNDDRTPGRFAAGAWRPNGAGNCVVLKSSLSGVVMRWSDAAWSRCRSSIRRPAQRRAGRRISRSRPTVVLPRAQRSRRMPRVRMNDSLQATALARYSPRWRPGRRDCGA